MILGQVPCQQGVAADLE